MLNHRAQVHARYVTAMATGLLIRRTFLEWQAATESKDAELGQLREGHAQLSGDIDALFNSLPDEVLDSIKGSNLRQHLHWMKRRIDEGAPDKGHVDMVDITVRDLPSIWVAYEAWFLKHSPSDEDFVRKVDRLLNIGQGDSAIRKGWAVFKSRLVETFGVADDLDGDRLAIAVFGPNGAARGRFSDAACEGYLNLLKGLYALNRNEVTHNDVTVDPQETEGVLMLLNSTLARVAVS